VRFSREDEHGLTASCKTDGGLARRYDGGEALEALCCHGVSEETWSR
jgi:hypothetical protein